MSEPAKKTGRDPKRETLDLVYMSYYHGEFARWTANLSRSESKTFWDLCVANYFGGTLSLSHEALASICKIPVKQFEQEWPAIKPHFRRCRGGQEIPKIIAWRNDALRRKAGHSKGGEMTAQKNAEKKAKLSGPESAGDIGLRVVAKLKDSSR